MDLNALALFVSVAEQGSFSRGAREHGIAKSTASARVRQLEAQLGVQLLARTTRTVALTEAGEALLDRGRDIVSAASEAEQIVSELRSTPTGLLRVSVPVSFGRRFLGAALADLLRSHPRLRLSIDLDDRDVDLVSERYDVAIRVGELPSSGLIARTIGVTRRVVVGAPAYFAERGRPRSPADLQKHECLRFAHQRVPDVWCFGGPEGQTQVRVEGRLLCNNGDILADAAAAGLGLAWLPDFIAASRLASGRLEPALDAYCRSEAPVQVVFAARKHRLLKVQRFVETLEAALRGLEEVSRDDRR